MNPKTLDDIVRRVRSKEIVTVDELLYAVVAFDVLLAQLDLQNHPLLLAEYFKAAETPPREYIGNNNDPANPEALAWYKAMQTVGAKH